MEESEDNLSAEDISNAKSPVKSKPKKRSLVERELETSLTARVTSPLSTDGGSTSRYGRARRLRKEDNTEPNKTIKTIKSPKVDTSPKSTVFPPVYKMHASNSPIKLDIPKTEPFANQIENIYSENNSLSRFGSAEKTRSPSKKYPKVYIRKDLIQLKDKDKDAEETVVLIKNMFSPVKSSQKRNGSSQEKSVGEQGKRRLSNKEQQSVVKTLDFDEKDDKDSKKDSGKAGPSKSEVFDIESKSAYQVGDLAWARMGMYPFWPCIITREPGTGLFIKTKLFGRNVRNIFNVTFFGDNGRRSWIVDSMLRPFLGQLEFETTRAHFTSEGKKKDPKLYMAFFISEKKMPQWLLSVEEAETLLREPKRLRIDLLNSMLLKVRPEKATPKREKGKRVTRTDSDVSLSESLYDTLFSEDDTKGNESDRRSKRKQSLDVSEVVTACLDNMAAKTGITKIQKQSHMDRWLLKAKTKTPEKSHLKSQAVQKAAKSSSKTKKPSNPSHKPYRFRSKNNESQSSDNNILNDDCKASTSSDHKSVTASISDCNDDDPKENFNDRLQNVSNVTDVSDNISKHNDESKITLHSESSIPDNVKIDSNAGKDVLNKIKQSIETVESMPSTSSMEVSGMSTSFEISRVDQPSENDIIESDINVSSEITDEKIYNDENKISSNNINKSRPITSSPNNIVTDTEISTEEIIRADKLQSNIHSDKESDINNDCTKNDFNENNVSEKEINKSELTIDDNGIEKKDDCGSTNIIESNESKSTDSIFNENKSTELDININMCNGVNQEEVNKSLDFRLDHKIKARQKATDIAINVSIENEKLCKNEKSINCLSNKPITRSKKKPITDVNFDFGSLKLNSNKIKEEAIASSSIMTNHINEINEVKHSLNACHNNENVSKLNLDVGNSAFKNNVGPKSEKKREHFHNKESLITSLDSKQKEEDNKRKFNSLQCNQAINGSTALPTTILKENKTEAIKNHSPTPINDATLIGDSLLNLRDSPQNDMKTAYNNPEFQKYLELKQDYVMDEHPELSQEEITNYLYKTWQYETKDIIDNETNKKIAAKGTNYKALDKERGRIKLIRKKPAEFTLNKTPPTIKSPVNGHHKEVKPIIISPKNRIIFLPKKNLTDSAKSNITFSNFKSVSSPILASVQCRLSNDSSVGIKVSIEDTSSESKKEILEMPNVKQVENNSHSLTKIISNEVRKSQKVNISLNITEINDSKNNIPVTNSNSSSKNVNEDTKSEFPETNDLEADNTSLLTNLPKIQKCENTPEKTDADDKMKNATPITDDNIKIVQNGLEPLAKLGAFIKITKTNKSDVVLKLPNNNEGHVIESKITEISANNSSVRQKTTERSSENDSSLPAKPITVKNDNIAEDKPNIKHKAELTNILNNKTVSENHETEKTEALENSTLSKAKDSKFNITPSSDILLENCRITPSTSKEIKSTPAETLNNKLPNETEVFDKDNIPCLNKTNKGELEKHDNEITCPKNVMPASEKCITGPLNVLVDKKGIEQNQLNLNVKCEENNISKTENDKTDKKIVVKGNTNIKENDILMKTPIIEPMTDSKSEGKVGDPIVHSIVTDLGDKDINKSMKNPIDSNKNTNMIKINETESLMKHGLTEIAKSIKEQNPEFQKYVELKQDSVIDEHRELSHDEVIQYLYKTWQYEENNKSEKKITDEVDQKSLVKGANSINTDKDKKRKRLSRKKPSDSMRDNVDVKKNQYTIVNPFIKRNGFQEQFETSLNIRKECQVLKSSSEIHMDEPTQSKTVTVFDCKSVKNIDQNPNFIEAGNNQNVNEFPKKEPPKDNNDSKNVGVTYDDDNFESACNSSTDSETEMPLSSRRKQQKKQRSTQDVDKKALTDPEFVRYLEKRQDSVIDEHPELSHEEVIQYLYKTWLYEEDNKSEKKIIDEADQTSLVKGANSINADKDKKGKKLSRKRPSNSADVKKKPPTIINNCLAQNGYHEYHEKSLDSYSEEQEEVFSSKSESCYENVDEKQSEVDDENKSLNNEILNDVKFDSASPSSSESESDMALSKRKQTWKRKRDSAFSSSSESETEMALSERKQIWKEKRTQAEKKKSLMDAEFVRYLELRQDYVMDEHPELTEEEITNYLYKTWLYEEKIKNEKKREDEVDQTSLVKGVDFDLNAKRHKRKYKIIKEDSQESFKVSEVFAVEPKEKSKRPKVRPYYNEEISDIDEELALFEIFRKKKPIKPNEQQVGSNQPSQEIDFTDNNDDITTIEEYIYDEMDMVERYFEQLTTPKPNVFKGLVRERVCEICEKVSNLVKCKICHGMFHVDCVKKQTKTTPPAGEKTPSRGRKKKRKYQRRIKNSDEISLDYDGQSDERTQDASSDPNLSIEAEGEGITVDAEDFETKASAKMKEILGDLDNLQYEYESTNVAISWNARPGRCQVVDVKLNRPEDIVDASNFKCNDCEKFVTPKCFVCKSPVSPKESVEYRQKCQVAHCYKYYHLECLAHWPQTQFNGGDCRNKSKDGFEAMSCPRHVCHTCVSDDPRGCKTRFSGDKLARCVRCPATYHSFTKCLPAGSQILTGSLIICPRHYEHRPGKVPCHVNTGWCFICALGGTLICCEYCPTSFHAECLNIDPPEGGYMCEDCETGRLPLYGEMVWVKLGHYRWWPGIILHPSQIPANIMAVKHSQGEFVVRFFGQYDHYWVNRGRVFPFQEGDTGKISSQKSKIDAAFTMAVEHAYRACGILKNAIPNDVESQDIASSLLPPHYVKLKVNKPVGSLVNRKVDIEESSLTQCECDPNDLEPCGPYSQCLNRMLLTECGPTCRAGERCNNRAFEKRHYPKIAPYRTPHRGWGLKSLEDIRAGQFVIEYVGELLDEAEFQRRMRRKHEIRDENFYFLTLDKERMIDAGPKGNLARFMNHSCEPNCETQKWTVLGDVRVGLFAIDDIPANSELTFNYNLESAGIEKKQCMCGAKRCSGYIGAKPKQTEPQPKKNKMVKKIQKKGHKKTESQQKKPRGRPCKPKELTEIEKDLLIIKNATSEAEKDVAVKNLSVSSDSEYSERCSVDSKDGKGVKRKRSSQESLTLCLKRVKTGDGEEFRIDC